MVFTELTLGPGVGLHEVVASCNIVFFRIETSFTAEAVQPITDVISPLSWGPTTNIWNKFVGRSNDVNVPDLVDYSYAGYKNGEEDIPEHFNLPVYSVVDYGARPNDNRSDTAGILGFSNVKSLKSAVLRSGKVGNSYLQSVEISKTGGNIAFYWDAQEVFLDIIPTDDKATVEFTTDQTQNFANDETDLTFTAKIIAEDDTEQEYTWTVIDS